MKYSLTILEDSTALSSSIVVFIDLAALLLPLFRTLLTWILRNYEI